MGRLDRITDWNKLARQSGYCIATLARRLKVTTRQLERHFQQTIHRTPKVWIDGLRMDDAKRLLNRGEPVKEVSARLGFKYPEHFTRAFERIHGVTPSRAACHKIVKLPANVAKWQEMSHFGR